MMTYMGMIWSTGPKLWRLSVRGAICTGHTSQTRSPNGNVRELLCLSFVVYSEAKFSDG